MSTTTSRELSLQTQISKEVEDLLKHDTIRKKQIDETITQLKSEVSDNGKEYKIKTIWENAVYAKKLEGYLSSLYYLVS